MGLWKNFAEAIVRSAGYQVPMNMSTYNTAVKKGSGFNGLLFNMQQGLQQNGLQAPNPPKAPEDPSDVEAQQKYNEALVAYNQKFRNYQSQVMTMFMQRFNMMQQTIWATQQQQNQQLSSQGVSSPMSNPGVGGILGGDSDV